MSRALRQEKWFISSFVGRECSPEMVLASESESFASLNEQQSVVHDICLVRNNITLIGNTGNVPCFFIKFYYFVLRHKRSISFPTETLGNWILAFTFWVKLVLLFLEKSKSLHRHVSYLCNGYDTLRALTHAFTMVLNFCIWKVLSSFQLFGIYASLHIPAILVSLLLLWLTLQDL